MDEFVLVWFEDSQGWWVLFENGWRAFVAGPVGAATKAALDAAQASEADFDCLHDSGDYYRFRKVQVEQPEAAELPW